MEDIRVARECFPLLFAALTGRSGHGLARMARIRSPIRSTSKSMGRAAAAAGEHPSTSPREDLEKTARRAGGRRKWVAALASAVALSAVPPAAAGAQSSSPYPDVGGGAYYSEAVEALAADGVFEGTECNEGFCPDQPLDRATMAVWTVRVLDGQDPAPVISERFADVDASHPHAAFIERFAELGVTKGCRDGSVFCPDDTVARAQMAVFLARAFDLDGGPYPAFSDVPADAWHAADVAKLATSRITHGCGDGSRFCPDDPTPRAQMAVFLFRALGSVGRPTEPGSAQGVGMDTWDRNAVLAAYEAEFGRVEPDAGFTGDVDSCSAGTTSQSYRDSVVQRVNWYRMMAGLASVIEDPALSATAQRKALIMLAQRALSHTPSPEWACFTEIDFQGENLALGVAGVDVVDGYMQDPGDNNLAVGHRQQILSPFVTEIGTGDVFDPGSAHRVFRAANAMHLSYDFDLAPEVRDERGFVAWPPPGFVPPETVWGRWSFAMEQIVTEETGHTTTWYLSGPDFSESTVSVFDDDGPVPARIIHRDDALVWAVHGDRDSDLLPKFRDGDHCYTVKISGVRIGGTTQAPYDYAVCVLDTGSRWIRPGWDRGLAKLGL